MPSSSGFSPREVKLAQVSATGAFKGLFFVTNTLDYNHGLGTLKVEFDKKTGEVSSAKITSIDLSQKDSDVVLERTNIQRASDVVFIQQGGKDYAIVADDNLDYIDPYWGAKNEAFFRDAKEFSIDIGAIEKLTQKDKEDEEGAIKFATQTGAPIARTDEKDMNAKLLSATTKDKNDSKDAKFADTGIFVMYRSITKKDSDTLRKGDPVKQSGGSEYCAGKRYINRRNDRFTSVLSGTASRSANRTST